MKVKKIITITMCTLICIMAIGYAAFATNLTINGTANITSTWKVLFTKIEEVSKTSGVTIKELPTAEGTNATFNVSLTSPGDSIVYKITVANQGTLDAIINDITASETGSDAIKFAITGIKKGDKLGSKSATTFDVTISYDSNVTSQPSTIDNTLMVSINYVQDLGQTVSSEDLVIQGPTLANKILKDNIAESDANIDLSKGTTSVTSYDEHHDTTTRTITFPISETEFATDYKFNPKTGNYSLSGTIITEEWANMKDKYETYPYYLDGYLITGFYKITEYNGSTSGAGYHYGVTGNYESYKGLYYTSTNTEDNKVTYYYRGDVQNNYVSFAGFTWRIIRINEDGSIRLIKQDSIGSSVFNDNQDSHAYVGYMYGNINSTTYEGTHANVNSSVLKTVIDEWYKNNLINYSSYLADAGFCGDRSVSTASSPSGTGIGAGKEEVFVTYGFSKRKTAPQFACPQENDLYTTTTSTKGNKALTYPIGLLAADEIVYAGNLDRSNTYLVNGTSSWIMTPNQSSIYSLYNVADSSNYILDYSSIYTRNVTDKHEIRPVINLKSNVQVTKGNGTIDNPYVIKTN